VIITKLQVAPVELIVSSESSCAVRLPRVESCRVESRRAKWNLGYTSCQWRRTGGGSASL